MVVLRSAGIGAKRLIRMPHFVAWRISHDSTMRRHFHTIQSDEAFAQSQRELARSRIGYTLNSQQIAMTDDSDA